MDETENTNNEEEKKKKPSSKVKKGVLISTIAVLSGLSVAAVVGAKEGYDFAFKRFDRPDYALTQGVTCIARSYLTRKEMPFYSDGVRLQGYYYPCDCARGLVVLCHGIHAGADDYLPIAEYMVGNGFAVFAFDYKGTYDSEGDSTVGMCESLVDLDHALNYVEREPLFAGLPVYLIGHSWGGYAAASVLSLHKSVQACACIAAPSNGYTLILEKGEQYAGKVGSKGIPELFLNTYQKILFGDYVKYDAVKGINSTNIPVLIAHGANDGVISPSRQAILAHREEIRKDNVRYVLYGGVQDGHNSVWHSQASVEYQKEVDAAWKKLKKSGASYEELKAYNNGVDHALYSAVNEDLMQKIVELFESTGEKVTF